MLNYQEQLAEFNKKYSSVIDKTVIDLSSTFDKLFDEHNADQILPTIEAARKMLSKCHNIPTQMQINWQSPTTIKNLKLEYTKANDTKFSDSIVVDAEYKSFSRQNDEPFSGTIYVGFSTPRYVWNVNLNDLTPKTKYIYRIIKDNEVLSEIYNFETASKEDDEFSFLFITDPQYYDEEGAQIFNTITERHIKNDDVKFAFITGDISDKGGNSSYWDMFYTKSSIKKIPFAATVGNHDYYDSKTTRTDNYIFNNFFYNPQNGPEHVKGSSYYFVYNQALFIMLDSEEKYNTEEQKQWVRVSSNIELLDTPGVLWPKFEDQMVGLRLALIGSIKDEILNIDELSIELIKILVQYYPNVLTERYSVDETKEPVNILEQIAENRKCISKGNELDYSKAAILLIDDFRSGKLGKLTLEMPSVQETIGE